MTRKHTTIWNILDGLKGDKVVWMILLTLIMCSVVCIFSSTSLEKEVLRGEKTRMDMVWKALKFTLVGLAAIIVCYKFIRIRGWRFLSQFGFIGSFLLLLIIVTHFKGIPYFQAGTINGEYRIINCKGLQIHVYEIVKVAMVMYISWVIDTYKHGKFWLTEKLSKIKKLEFFSNSWVQLMVYLYIPICIVAYMVIKGSGSSAVFITLVLMATVVMGGLKFKEIALPCGAGALALAGLLTLNTVTGGKIIDSDSFRVDTWSSRMKGLRKQVKEYKMLDSKDPRKEKLFGKIWQPYSALIAIHDGGLIGKGPGQSTQRYIVPVYFEDYMYSFVVEEYGLFGALVILGLYLSLLSRGSVIARNCPDEFGKNVIAGLVILISGQGFLHIMVNVNLIPMTGQTLPIISYGTSAFLMFCMAFGIILSISREAATTIERETLEADPLKMNRTGEQEYVKDVIENE